MQSLSQFLDKMPKPMLREMHARAYEKKGLIHNALILSEVERFFSESSRAQAFFLSLEPWQQLCLSAIYNSRGRGLETHEIRLLVSAEHRKKLDPFLLEAVRNLYLYREKNPSRASFIYHGFLDFMGIFQAEMQPYEAGSAHWFHYEMLEWHICLVLSFAKLGKLRVNNSKVLHRRSITICEEAFTHSRNVSPEAATDEILLIFHFLLSKEWLLQKESLLVPSASAFTFLNRNGFRLRTEFLKWWVDERFSGDKNSLFHFFKQMKDPVRASGAARLFWPLDPVTRLQESGQTVFWSGTSRVLRELWLMGYLNFSVVQHRIQGVRLTELGRELLAESVEIPKMAAPSALPNFELILSASSPPRLLFLTACLAEVKNDEPFLRFVLERSVYLKGLQSGFSEEDVDHFMSWNHLPENVVATLSEWASSYFDAKLSTVRLLKISKPEVRKSLARFDHFMECVLEEIPSYGFILRPERETTARELLKHYGLEPGIRETEEQAVPLDAKQCNKDFILPLPPSGEVDYAFKMDSDFEDFSQILSSTKYGRDFCKLETPDLFKVLRYAHMMGSPLVARVCSPEHPKKEKQEIQFNIKSIHLSKDPYHVMAESPSQEAFFPLYLDTIEEIKLLHP